MMDEVTKIAKSMRISHHQSDEEIQDNIDACIADMKRVGVNTESPDSLIYKAKELYCKAEFGYAGKGDEFKKRYEELRDAMSLAERYREEADDV